MMHDSLLNFHRGGGGGGGAGVIDWYATPQHRTNAFEDTSSPQKKIRKHRMEEIRLKTCHWRVP